MVQEGLLLGMMLTTQLLTGHLEAAWSRSVYLPKHCTVEMLHVARGGFPQGECVGGPHHACPAGLSRTSYPGPTPVSQAALSETCSVLCASRTSIAE